MFVWLLGLSVVSLLIWLLGVVVRWFGCWFVFSVVSMFVGVLVVGLCERFFCCKPAFLYAPTPLPQPPERWVRPHLC